ncbi:DUF3299 domain-containing protein [Herbaspirillum rhizosphaerae]|uniref:DUF3299 domain-containing protein n=1 Tax=Herbaspirillum rhizosphaerae TaxID=346179 RepID=UPI00067ACEF9|nr:DUF3299 domain-containing protein [Herbaspirillum rhizosphaerae]
MKSITWIGGIVAAGLLVGYGAHLAATPKTLAAAPTAEAINAGTAAGAASAPYSDNAQYKVGDHLQQSPDLSNKPYKPSGKNEGAFREIAWESLMPKNWDAMAPFKGLKLDKMEDGDPRAMEALWKAKKYWKNAPIDPSMDGVSIRIPGFVVSLEREGEALKEFLLVPYFGACIHVPPPPANQIIHVHSSKPVKNTRTMDAVWISGVLKVEHSDTMMGTAGYSLASVKVEPYTDQAPAQ